MSGYPMEKSEVVAWFKDVRDALKKHHPSVDIAAFAILLNQPNGYASMMTFLDGVLPIEMGWGNASPNTIPKMITEWQPAT